MLSNIDNVSIKSLILWGDKINTNISDKICKAISLKKLNKLEILNLGSIL